jgi:hypothetical protein
MRQMRVTALSQSAPAATTSCHDNFSYYSSKLLIPGGQLQAGFGRTYAIESKLVNN